MKPKHPSYMLAEFIKEHNIRKIDLVDYLDISRQAMHNFLTERSDLSLVLARKLSIFTGIPLNVWLESQTKVNIYLANQLEVSSVSKYEQGNLYE